MYTVITNRKYSSFYVGKLLTLSDVLKHSKNILTNFNNVEISVQDGKGHSFSIISKNDEIFNDVGIQNKLIEKFIFDDFNFSIKTNKINEIQFKIDKNELHKNQFLIEPVIVIGENSEEIPTSSYSLHKENDKWTVNKILIKGDFYKTYKTTSESTLIEFNDLKPFEYLTQAVLKISLDVLYTNINLHITEDSKESLNQLPNVEDLYNIDREFDDFIPSTTSAFTAQ